MAWANDGHGLRVTGTEVKLFTPSHTWGMKLSQLHKQAGAVRILTFSLPSLPYVVTQFNRRPHDIRLLCHSKFARRAAEIKQLFPLIEVALHDASHAKMLLIEPATVYVGSANFGDSGWAEVCIGLRSREGHDWYVNTFERLWSQARVLS